MDDGTTIESGPGDIGVVPPDIIVWSYRRGTMYYD
jgi:hypothetical protein